MIPLYMGLPHLSTLLELGIPCNTASFCLSNALQPQTGTCSHCGGPFSGLGRSLPTLADPSSHLMLAYMERPKCGCVWGRSFRFQSSHWHRLTVYMQIAWRQLRQKVRLEQLQFSDARALMAAKFGIEGRLWSLHEIALQVLPVPPRPP